MKGSSPDLHSPLYDRYNGFLFGALFTRAFEERADYRAWRPRMQEFLDEVEVAIRLPREHEVLRREHAELWSAAREEFTSCSEELADFYLLASAAMQSLGLEDAEQRAGLRSLGRRLLRRNELDRDAWDRALDPGATPRPALQRVVALLAESLLSVEPEDSTCFLALPPGPESALRVSALYRPLLSACGRRPLRAWGGFGGERRQEMLVRVLRRSGSVLADLSGFHPSVVFELGVARGAGLRAYLFTSTHEHEPPFDLDLSWVQRYDPRSTQWPEEALEQGLYFLSAVDAVEDGASGGLGHASLDEVVARLQRAEAFSSEGLDT